jgi:hypothetical protein
VAQSDEQCQAMHILSSLVVLLLIFRPCHNMYTVRLHAVATIATLLTHLNKQRYTVD